MLTEIENKVREKYGLAADDLMPEQTATAAGETEGSMTEAAAAGENEELF